MSSTDGSNDGAPEGGATTTRRPRGSGPTTTFEYKVYLDGSGVFDVGQWEAEHAETTLFCSDQLDEHDHVTREPRCIDGDDLLWIATVEAGDRDAAVSMILKGDVVTNERAKVVKAAHENQVNIDFKVLPTSKIGEVPVHWKIEPTFSIGGKAA